MAEYYLISQLPSLDGLGDNAPLPITDERFTELCERFLGKKALRDMKNITLAVLMRLRKNSKKKVRSAMSVCPSTTAQRCLIRF